MLVCLPSASPLPHRPHHELNSMESVHTLKCDGCAFGAKWAPRLHVWSAGVEKHDLSRLETKCTGDRGLCSWSRKQHQSRTSSHHKLLPPSMPHAFAHVVCSKATGMCPVLVPRPGRRHVTREKPQQSQQVKRRHQQAPTQKKMKELQQTHIWEENQPQQQLQRRRRRVRRIHSTTIRNNVMKKMKK